MGDWDVVGERAAPKAGAGEWDVVGEAPFLPIQQKPQVGAGEAFIDDLKAGSARLGRDALAVIGSPALAVDAISNKLTGQETGASDWWARNVFGPYSDAVDAAAAKRAATERSLPAELAGAVGGLINTIPAMIGGNKIQQTMKVAEGIPALGQLLTRAFAGAQPMAVPVGVDRYADVKAMGADTLTAANAGMGSYANMAAQGMAPMGAQGNLLKRVVTGAAVNPVMGAAGRAGENIINATSNDPRLQQQVVSPEQAIIDAVMGAGMHGVMGAKAESTQTPGAVHADRNAYDNVARQLASEAQNIGGIEAPTIQADGTVIGDMTRPQMQQGINRAAETRQAYENIPAAEADPSRPANAPPVPKDTMESAKGAFDRMHAADSMELPPTVREGVQKENSDAFAKQAFDIAARRQSQADADLANRNQIGPDYQGGGSAAHGGEFDAGIRRVTLLDGEVPVEVVAHDGKTATVSIEQNGKTIEFDVEAKRITEHDIPAGLQPTVKDENGVARGKGQSTAASGQRMAQDFMARSSEPKQGVGVGTMAGEKMPRRSTDRIAGDEIGGLTQGYDPTPKDGGKGEGTVLPPDAGNDIVPRGGSEGQTINGESSRPTAGFDAPNGQKQIGERRMIEDKNRFAVDEQGRAVDRENRQPITGEGKPLHAAPEPAAKAQEAPPQAEQTKTDTTTPPKPENAPVAQENVQPLTTEQRAKDPETLDELKRMSKNAGWQEEGGKLLRDAEGNAVARTKWIPREPWFAAGMGEKNVHEAVARVEAGKPMTKKHRDIVERMLEYIEENDVLGRKAGKVEDLNAAGLDESPANLSDYDMAEKALLLYPDQFEAIAVRNADKPEESFYADLRSLLDEQGNQHTTETAAQVPERANEQNSGSRPEGSDTANRPHETNAGAGQGVGEVGFDLAKLDGKKITVDGKTVDAVEHIRGLDSRIEALNKLLKCLE